MAEIGGNNSTSIDWSNLAGSAISAGSGLLGSLIAGGYNRKRQRESQAWAEKMWQQQNEYNLPINQMARLKEAGINPNLAFGSSASAMGTNVPSPSHYSESPDFGAPIQRGISEYFQRRFERKQLLTQIEWQNEQIRKLRMDNDTTSLLLDDYRAMKRSEYWLGKLKNDVDLNLYGRQRDLELDLLSGKRANEWDRFNAHIPAALASHYRAQDALLGIKQMSEYEDYLTKRSKGKYERSYYDRYLNPYETSTTIGFLRALAGVLGIVDPDNRPAPGDSNGDKIKNGLHGAYEEASDYLHGRKKGFWHDLGRYVKQSFRHSKYEVEPGSFRW